MSIPGREEKYSINIKITICYYYHSLVLCYSFDWIKLLKTFNSKTHFKTIDHPVQNVGPSNKMFGNLYQNYRATFVLIRAVQYAYKRK